MALYTKREDKIPADAVRLDQDDAIKFMRTIIESWAARSDVFYLSFSPGILGGLTALTGIYVNNYYRTRLRLQSFGRFSTYLPCVVIPSFASFAMHVNKIQNSLIIENYKCSVCMEMRSTALQVVSGIGYPVVLAPLGAFMMATRYYTYNVPAINKDPLALWKLYVKLSRPMALTFAAIAALHLVVAGYVTDKQFKEVANVKRQLMQMEEEALSGGS